LRRMTFHVAEVLKAMRKNNGGNEKGKDRKDHKQWFLGKLLRKQRSSATEEPGESIPIATSGRKKKEESRQGSLKDTIRGGGQKEKAKGEKWELW